MADFTTKEIVNTFTKLLRTYSFNKITVLMICKECGISPNTFYYHFKDKYDLLNYWISGLLSLFDFSYPNWKESAKKMFKAIRDNKTISYNVFSAMSRDDIERVAFSSTGNSLQEYVKHKAKDLDIDKDTLEGITNFCRFAILGFIIDFLWKDMNQDIDAKVEQLSTFISIFVNNAIKNYTENSIKN